MEYVCARCGQYQLLFPTGNIETIVPILNQLEFTPLARSGRVRVVKEHVFFDARLWLGIAAPTSAAQVVTLVWVSSDRTRRLRLIVDEVTEIVAYQTGELLMAPALPLRLATLCDRVMPTAEGMRLSIRRDLQLNLDRFAERRRFLGCLLVSRPRELEENI